MRVNITLAAIAVVSVAVVTPIQAANNLGIAQGFNAFILSDLNAVGGDTEGRLTVGNNATMQFYGVGATLTNSHGARDDLIVGNNLHAIGGWQVFNGNAVYGGSLINAPMTPNGSTFAGTPINFARAATELGATSTSWSSIAPNGSAIYDGFATLTISGSDPVLIVINVPGALWSNPSITSRIVNAPAGSTVLINIDGATNSMTGGLALNGVSRETVLWNFYQTTALNSSFLSMKGSVLAPFAHLDLNGGNFEGISVLQSANTFNGGEFHNYGFNGKIPEPATPSLAALGLVAMRRLRRF